MNVWKFTYRMGWLLSLVMILGIVVRLFMPVLERNRDLRARRSELQADIQREAEKLRMLRLKQEKLREDPRFIEKIAREDLGYAKPGETVFRFVDDDRP